MSEYRGPATIMAAGMVPVEVDAYLVATGVATWGGRITPLRGESLLPFLRALGLEIRIGKHHAQVVFSSLGASASEIEGLGPAPF